MLPRVAVRHRRSYDQLVLSGVVGEGECERREDRREARDADVGAGLVEPGYDLGLEHRLDDRAAERGDGRPRTIERELGHGERGLERPAPELTLRGHVRGGREPTLPLEVGVEGRLAVARLLGRTAAGESLVELAEPAEEDERAPSVENDLVHRQEQPALVLGARDELGAEQRLVQEVEGPRGLRGGPRAEDVLALADGQLAEINRLAEPARPRRELLPGLSSVVVDARDERRVLPQQAVPRRPEPLEVERPVEPEHPLVGVVRALRGEPPEEVQTLLADGQRPAA